MIRGFTAVMALVAGMAMAQPFEDWGESGDWSIKVDKAVGDGCFMQRTYDSGTVISIGYVPDKKGAFFSAFNTAWTQIEDGATGNVIFDFGDSRFQGEAVGKIVDGVPGGYAFFNNPEFASEFGRRLSVKFSGEGGGGEEIDLGGSSAGLRALKACQEAQG